MRAVEQYTDDQRVIANTSIAEARQHSVVINDRLEALVDDLNAQVVRAREQVVADVAHTTRSRLFDRGGGDILGLQSLWSCFAQFSVPLHDVVAAMNGITAGNLQTPIPAETGGEIGTMAEHAAAIPREHRGARAACRGDRAPATDDRDRARDHLGRLRAVRFAGSSCDVQQQVSGSFIRRSMMCLCQGRRFRPSCEQSSTVEWSISTGERRINGLPSVLRSTAIQRDFPNTIQ